MKILELQKEDGRFISQKLLATCESTDDAIDICVGLMQITRSLSDNIVYTYMPDWHDEKAALS